MIPDTYNPGVAGLFPFRALRPTPAAAKDVAAVPYDVVTTEEAAALAHGNPLSFLRVSRPEIDLPPGTDPHADIVYDKAARNFRALQAAAPLVREEHETLYVYRLRMGSHEQTGVAACFAMDEYDDGLIKKHERTRRDKEDDRTRHMLAIGAQTGPVFLTYRATAAVTEVVQHTVSTTNPMFDFHASDGVRHVIWAVEQPDLARLHRAFDGVSALYIADGHHRAASAARARQELRAGKGPGEWDRFLGVAFPHDQVQILSYNRVVKDLGRESPASFLSRLSERFAVASGPAVPDRRGDVSMYLGGRWYTITMGDAAGMPIADRLDVNRLQETVLTPLLGIGDVRTDGRIDFVGGARGTVFLEEAVSSGRAAVAFSMYPVSLDDLMAISDDGGIMPPKSTWFEPKLRDGLLSHVF